MPSFFTFKKAIAGAAALAVGAVAFNAWQPSEPDPTPITAPATQNAPYRLLPTEHMHLTPSSQTLWTQAQGALRPGQRTTVTSRISGEIIRLPFQEGDSVQETDTIAEVSAAYLKLNRAGQQAQLDQIDAQITQARQQAERSQQLLERNTISTAQAQADSSTLAGLEASRRAQQALLDTTDLDIANTQITPLRGGVLTELSVQEGDTVSPGTSIATIDTLDRLELRIDIAQADAQDITPGKSAVITPLATGKEHAAKVTHVLPVAQSDNQRVPVILSIDNPDKTLFAGAWVKARIARTHIKDALVLPKEAIRDRDGEPHVLVVENAQAQRKTITLDPEWTDSQTVRITQGLHPGDHVLIAPLEQIQPGDSLAFESAR